LNKSTRIIINETNARAIVNNAKKIDKNIFTSATINMNSVGRRKINSFSELLKTKKSKK
jgi:hypothetical protein